MAVPSPRSLRSLDDIYEWVKLNSLTEAANTRFLEIMQQLHEDFAQKYPGENLVINFGSGYLDTKEYGTRAAYFIVLQMQGGQGRTRIALLIDESGEKFEHPLIVPDDIVETPMQ